MTPLPFPVPRQLFPVEHRFLDLDGARIHYVDEGSGSTLLLLHGNPAWSFLYRKIIAALSDEYRCVAPDFPGYGMSTAGPGYGFTPREHSAMLERFVERLGLTDLTIMVQDWGGPIGLGFAARRPELVRGFIIGNTWAWPHDRDLRIRAFSWIMGGPIGTALTRSLNFVPRFFFSRGFARPIDRDVLDAYLAPWSDWSRRAPAVIAPRQLVAASPYLAEVQASLRTLADRPALIVWGTRDFAFREANRRRFEAAFPHHRTVLLNDASHFLQEDAGERIAEAFKAFDKNPTGGPTDPIRLTDPTSRGNSTTEFNDDNSKSGLRPVRGSHHREGLQEGPSTAVMPGSPWAAPSDRTPSARTTSRPHITSRPGPATPTNNWAVPVHLQVAVSNRCGHRLGCGGWTV